LLPPPPNEHLSRVGGRFYVDLILIGVKGNAGSLLDGVGQDDSDLTEVTVHNRTGWTGERPLPAPPENTEISAGG
jgi:hypothetical protein